MTKFTNNNQKEKISRIEFESLVQPWACTSFEPDVGIDLIVQPFDEKAKEADGSLRLFEKRFLVQLKSTETENPKLKSGHASIYIDVAHLLDWQRQAAVMVARYYISEKCFYYTWIDKVKIKKHQKGQTIYLSKKLSELNRNEAKEDILRHLKPISIRSIYIPNFQDPKQGIMEQKFDNIRDSQQLIDLINSGEFNLDTARRLAIENEITNLIILIRKNPDDLNNQYMLARLYIVLKKYDAALAVLGMLVLEHNLIEAKILGRIIIEREQILEEIKKCQFVYYLKWKQKTPPGTNLKVRVLFDGDREYTLTEYDERGVFLPIQDFKQFKVAVAFESDGRETPILYNEGFCLMKGLLDSEGKLLYEFGEIIA